MYVTPINGNGSYLVSIPKIWDRVKVHQKTFSSSSYNAPKLAAQSYVTRELKDYYGEERADFIVSIPQFVHTMKLGCGVSYRDTFKVSRGVRYPCFDISYTEYVSNHLGQLEPKRKRRSFSYMAENKSYIEHKVSLEVARIRASKAHSKLHESALRFEYDLSEFEAIESKNPMIGQQFSSLTVVRKVPVPSHIKKGTQKQYWECLCGCGKSIIAHTNQLSSGRTKSCGCNSINYMIGKQFGDLKVIKRAPKPKNIKSELVYWLLECTCGNTTVKSGYVLRQGKCTTHCGCKNKGT